MNRFFEQRTLQLNEINARVLQDPTAFIAEECQRYHDNVNRVADHLHAQFSGRCLVMLSGPSSAGKTTTANNLKRGLEAYGRQVSIVSLDDFYRGWGLAPQLPDGTFDYESIEALDLPQLHTCMQNLLTDGVAQMPRFNFETHMPETETYELRVSEHSVVIFEGIHALNPLLQEHLPEDGVFKVFINVMSRVLDGDDVLMTRRQLRLCRRMLRDYQFRNSSVENTLDMWRQVVRGERLYMMPFADTAQAVFDTTHAFAPTMLAPKLLPLLREVPKDSPFADQVEEMIAALSKLVPLSTDRLPHDALLREFVGHE